MRDFKYNRKRGDKLLKLKKKPYKVSDFKWIKDRGGDDVVCIHLSKDEMIKIVAHKNRSEYGVRGYIFLQRRNKEYGNIIVNPITGDEFHKTKKDLIGFVNRYLGLLPYSSNIVTYISFSPYGFANKKIINRYKYFPLKTILNYTLFTEERRFRITELIEHFNNLPMEILDSYFYISHVKWLDYGSKCHITLFKDVFKEVKTESISDIKIYK